MLENIIFHFVFVSFCLWAFVWWLATKRKCEQFKKSLIPALLKSKIELPQDRSLVVRSLVCLQEELSEYFHCKVKIEVKFANLSSLQNKSFLEPLCSLIWKNEFEQNKYFILKGVFSSSKELISCVRLKNNRKSLIFNYDFDKNIWNVEVECAR